MLRDAQDPEEIWHIKRRIAELTPMLTQCNDICFLLEHYYEVGGGDCHRDQKYSFNGKTCERCERQRKEEAIDDPALRQRVNRFTARDVHRVSFPEENHDADSAGEGSKQKYDMPDPKTCGRQDLAHHQIPWGESIDALFKDPHYRYKEKRHE